MMSPMKKAPRKSAHFLISPVTIILYPILLKAFVKCHHTHLILISNLQFIFYTYYFLYVAQGFSPALCQFKDFLGRTKVLRYIRPFKPFCIRFFKASILKCLANAEMKSVFFGYCLIGIQKVTKIKSQWADNRVIADSCAG